MASNNLWTIIHALQHRGAITPRDVCQLLGCGCKKAHRLLEHLILVEAIKNVGKPYHPVYELQAGGETRIKPVRQMQPGIAKAAVKARTRPERQVSHTPKIAEVCRQNWQGYQIHKIFGSARV
ncbi:TPA: hypothetical protein ACPZVC_004476 [Enterobacter hormaechei subsp. xiangfangensis]|nr:hypothetical protein [Enterobacter hormaechei]HAS0931664.1 hypothetical protein [Enterobacter hormaechei]HAS0936422.1 hypothetical protein [Enterobacter hormaechei]HAS0941060.1 hypothetical protein [Enterobacter hormaechei]HAS0945765.1 hypothetical protein [Enterobacter hormaechei]